MMGEQFFYWYGVLAASVTAMIVVLLLTALPGVVIALVGRGVLEVVLWWDEQWLEYDDGESKHETQQNKIEVYSTAMDEGRWEYHVSHTLSVTHRKLSNGAEWYLDVMDKYVWSNIPVVGR